MAKGPTKPSPAKTGTKVDKAAQKEERLARALRENLKRRKAFKENPPEGGEDAMIKMGRVTKDTGRGAMERL